MDMQKEIELMNQIICDAVNHGGDAGGPYFSSWKSLTKSIEDWLEAKGYSEFYGVDIQDDYCKIVDIETARQHEQKLIEENWEKEF